MTLTGPWVPETEVEDRLLEDIHIATRRANQDGVSKERIASLLAFMASATLTPPGDGDGQQEAEERLQEAFGGEPDPEEPATCPECGEPVEDVMIEMGGGVISQPCGCRIEWEDRHKLGSMAPDTDEKG